MLMPLVVRHPLGWLCSHPPYNTGHYVTLFPCHECAKILAQVGIGEVVYLSDKYDGTESNQISKRILDSCGISYRGMNLQN